MNQDIYIDEYREIEEHARILRQQKKKRAKSKRNRHTGRMNAYKTRIIEHGKRVTCKRGYTYFSAHLGAHLGASLVRL